MSEPSPNKRDLVATLVVIGSLVVFLAGRGIARRVGAHPTRDACAEALDRHQEQLARAADRRPPTREEILAASDREGAIDRCTHELTADEIECASRSNNADEFERCLP